MCLCYNHSMVNLGVGSLRFHPVASDGKSPAGRHPQGVHERIGKSCRVGHAEQGQQDAAEKEVQKKEGRLPGDGERVPGRPRVESGTAAVHVGVENEQCVKGCKWLNLHGVT